jgi:hypothetical protein
MRRFAAAGSVRPLKRDGLPLGSLAAVNISPGTAGEYKNRQEVEHSIPRS